MVDILKELDPDETRGEYVPTLTVVKRISFDAAHYLPGYEGKCKNMHGHHWVVELGVNGQVNPETGMVVDFAELKKFLSMVRRQFDHHLVNDTIQNPTAENIALYIEDLWEHYSLEGVELAFVRVWETEDSYAELREEGWD